jgi:hypothetical protein
MTSDVMPKTLARNDQQPTADPHPHEPNQGIAQEIKPLPGFMGIKNRIDHLRHQLRNDEYIFLEPHGIGKIVGIEEIAVKDRIAVTIRFPVREHCHVYLYFWVPAHLVQLDDTLRMFLQEAESEEPPPYLHSDSEEE